MAPQVEIDRFQAFIDHIAAQPDLGDRVRLTFDGLLQLFRERVLAATNAPDGHRLESFSDLVGLIDTHKGAIEAAVINGSPVVISGSVELFPGDLGYVGPDKSKAGAPKVAAPVPAQPVRPIPTPTPVIARPAVPAVNPTLPARSDEYTGE